MVRFSIWAFLLSILATTSNAGEIAYLTLDDAGKISVDRHYMSYAIKPDPTWNRPWRGPRSAGDRRAAYPLFFGEMSPMLTRPSFGFPFGFPLGYPVGPYHVHLHAPFMLR